MNRLIKPKLFRHITYKPVINNIRCISNSIPKLDTEYTKNEEWSNYNNKNKNNNIKIGLNQNAIEQLGEIVYIDFPYDIDDKINENDDLVFIESVKATESIKAPFDCIIKDINNDLEDNLDQLNGSPECIENSWLIKIDKLDA